MPAEERIMSNTSPKNNKSSRRAPRYLPSPDHHRIEQLETRQLLSAASNANVGGGILVPSITQIKIPTIFVPLDAGSVQVALNNTGAGVAIGVVKISVFASTDQTLSDDDVPLATAAFNHVSAHVAAGKPSEFTGKFSMPANIPPGHYFLLVKLTVISGFPGSTVSTVPVASADSAQAQWSFGTVGNQKNVQLIHIAPDGAKETFKLNVGTGTLSEDLQGNLRVTTTGTTSASNFSMTVSGGVGSATLANFTADGSFGTINAPKTNLDGLLMIAGNVKSLTVDNISSGFNGSIGGELTSLTTSGNFTGMLASASEIGTLLVKGTLSGSTILAGANLGTDGLLGGVGSAADSFAAGTIGTLHVLGEITTSFIGAGVDPVDGIFGNGNDVSAGPSLLKSIIAARGSDADTLFEASAFGVAKLPKAANTSTDSRFIVL
jgi:hypothetical protein